MSSSLRRTEYPELCTFRANIECAVDYEVQVECHEQRKLKEPQALRSDLEASIKAFELAVVLAPDADPLKPPRLVDLADA